MARIQKESLEAKIKKAEEKVFKTSEAYDAACKELNDLRAKLSAIEHEELIDAFVKSGRSYDEVMEFLRAGMVSESEEDVPGNRRKRKYTKRRRV